MPLLAVSADLKHRGADILCVGSKRPEDRALVEAAGFEFVAIDAGKLRRYFSLQTLLEPFRIWSGFRQAQKVIRRFKPDVVFAKGGYVSMPVVWAAKRKGIPIVLHESDTVPGLANRRAAKAASSVAVAFPPETLEGLPPQKLVHTGNPLRDGVIKGKADRARKRFKLSPHYPVLLVLGGSQGSVALNDLVWEALPTLLADVQVVHQVGERNAKAVRNRIAQLPGDIAGRYHPRGFIGEELFDLYAASDLIVSRAGANILAEIAAVGKPSILVPLPTAAADHQRRNAEVFAARNAAVVLEEGTLTAEELNGAVKRLVRNQQRLAEMGRNARTLAHFDATRAVADLVWQTGSHRG